MQKYANLAELEKCCQTHIFLQNFVLIQPRTSPPKICKILIIFPILLTLTLTRLRLRLAAGDHVPQHFVVAREGREVPAVEPAAQWTRRVVANFGQNFGKMSLVFGCIGTDLCKSIRIFQKLPDYLAELLKIRQNFADFATFAKTFSEFSRKLLIFQTDFLLKF